MARIKCITLEILESTSYRTPKGNTYSFQKNSYTTITDSDDIAFFLSCGTPRSFVQEGVVDKVKKK